MWLSNITRLVVYSVGLILLTLSSLESAQAITSPLINKSAKYKTKSKTLIVKTHTKNNVTGNLQLLHGEGGFQSTGSSRI